MNMIDLNSFDEPYTEPMTDEQIFDALNVGQGDFLARVASANGIADEKYGSVFTEYVFEIVGGKYKGYSVSRNAYKQKTKLVNGSEIEDKAALVKGKQFNDKMRKATGMTQAKSSKELEGAFVFIKVLHIGPQNRPYVADVWEVPMGGLDQAMKDANAGFDDVNKTFNDDINF